MARTWEQARQIGRREGVAEGEAAASARAVLTVLNVRGIAVPEAARERVLSQKDPALLGRWLAKAVVASSLAEVIGDLGGSGRGVVR